MSLGHHKWTQQLHGTVICEYCGEFNSSRASVFCHKHPRQPENFMRAELHRQRLELQSHDCGYGETGPGLIHCPIDKPCTLHQLERLRDVVRQVHGLAYKAIATDWRIGLTKETLTEIHKLTKEQP